MNSRSRIPTRRRPAGSRSRARAGHARGPEPRSAPSGARGALSPAARLVREALQDTARIERLSRTFRALGDVGRSKLILALSMGELNVSELAAGLGASPSATSHQLRILRDLDLVRVRRAGRSQVYALNEAGFGLCSPRVCHAWRETLNGGPVEIAPLRGRKRED